MTIHICWLYFSFIEAACVEYNTMKSRDMNNSHYISVVRAREKIKKKKKK